MRISLSRFLSTTFRSARVGAVVALVMAIGHSATHAEAEESSPFSETERAHWSFQPVSRPEIPRVRSVERVRTPIDVFVLRRLEEENASFSPRAHKRSLLRRLKFDLLGLPPTPDEMEQFLADQHPLAYERLVERLLADPRHGETSSRNWLDLVRFAETSGFKSDPARPQAYRYRDYVIRSFNEDAGYDRFIREQIAGDELYPDSFRALVATGFNRMWPDESNASDILLARQDALNDLTANVGSVFLGLSVGCAQCHDHKFDPILQRDFYQLQAYFAGIVPKDRVPMGTVSQLADYQQRLDEWYRQTESVRSELHEMERTARAKAAEVKRLKFPAVVLDAIDTAPEDRSVKQQQLAFWSERQIVVEEKKMLAHMSHANKSRLPRLKGELEQFRKARPNAPRFVEVMAVVEVDSRPPVTSLLSGGSYDAPEEEVSPAVPTVLRPTVERSDEETDSRLALRPGTSGRRAELAEWLTDPRNPLTARVMVNRIWQDHFGIGLVDNANDFGLQTPPPSHPQLLDWLAAEFVSRDWSIKAIRRLIVTSEVYRQSTRSSTDSKNSERPAQLVVTQQPPYSSFPRSRLSAEKIRDSLLAVAGKLDTRMYGPGVRPPLPPGFSDRYGWEVSKSEADQNRRSVYLFAKRNLPYPFLQSFDLPDMHESCARRAETTIAPQALMLLNSQLVLDAARGFALRIVLEQPEAELADHVERAYVVAFGREPDQNELQAALNFIDEQCAVVKGAFSEEHVASKDARMLQTMDAKTMMALIDFCHVLMNANEFFYVD